MTFGEDLAAGLEELRGYAVDRMRGTCIIERPTGDKNVGGGKVEKEYTQVYPDPSWWPDTHPHTDGKCQTRYPGIAAEQNRELAGQTTTESRVTHKIPHGVSIRPGDRVTILSDLDNPQLVGRVLRVESVDDQSQATAQRLRCTDVQSGVIE